MDSGTAFNANSSLSAVTLSGVNTANPFGSMGENANLSTGITLNNIEAGNATLYAIGAQQGLGNPPLDINGSNAALVTGFIELQDSIDPGARTLSGGLIQQSTGSVTYSHFQTTRESAALALEINTIPEPEFPLLVGLAGVFGLLVRRRQ